MHFRDKDRRVWRLALTLGDVTRIRELTGVRVLARDAAETMGGKFGAVLWLLVEEQAQRVGVSRGSFLEAFQGDTTEATTAYFAALSAFLSPAPEKPAEAPAPGDSPTVPDPDLEAYAYELAGSVGVDPRPLTLRQLKWMAAGRHAAEVDRIDQAVRAAFLSGADYRAALTRNPHRPSPPPIPDGAHDLTLEEIQAKMAALAGGS